MPAILARLQPKPLRPSSHSSATLLRYFVNWYRLRRPCVRLGDERLKHMEPPCLPHPQSSAMTIARHTSPARLLHLPMAHHHLPAGHRHECHLTAECEGNRPATISMPICRDDHRASAGLRSPASGAPLPRQVARSGLPGPLHKLDSYCYAQVKSLNG